MKVTVVPGKTYAVTCSSEGTVSTTDGVVIASFRAGEQTLFVAPGAEVEVSDGTALVTESFKGAAPGSSARSGIQPGEDATLKSLLAESGTFTGAVNANGGINIPLDVGAPSNESGVTSSIRQSPNTEAKAPKTCFTRLR